MGIQVAQQSFIQFEQSIEHAQRIKYFYQALDNCKSIMDKQSDEEDLKNIKRMNYIYSRKLIEALSLESTLPYPDKEWFDYLNIILLHNPEICKNVLEDYPRLKIIWEQFLESHGDDIYNLIKTLSKKIKNEHSSPPLHNK